MVVHRLPTGFRNEVSPTCVGHIGLASTPTRIIQTRTREWMSDTNVGLWPTQRDWWEVGIKWFIFNCFTSICRIKQRFVDYLYLIWYDCIFCMYQECTYRIVPYWRLLLVNQYWELRRHFGSVAWVHLGCLQWTGWSPPSQGTEQ